jgi:hypothetical protein
MYSNDKEYRDFLRQIAKMDPTKFYETEDIFCDPTNPNVSPETIDEYNYDADAMKLFLDKVYSGTRFKPEFQRLYKAAAALMFSEDPEIGLAVLISYDYLACFYSTYTTFLKTPDEWRSEDDEFYKKLIERIET